MILLQRIVASVVSLLLIIVVLDLVRRKKLREEYSLLWLGAGLVMLTVAIKSKIIDWIANLLDIQHPAYGIIVIAMFIGLVLAIHFTLVLSKLTGHVWKLTQENSLLRAQIDEIEQRSSKE